MIGGRAIKSYNIKKQQFISRGEVDHGRSKRSRYQKLLGKYKIYSINGQGFEFNRYFFSPQDFKIIQCQLRELLGININ